MKYTWLKHRVVKESIVPCISGKFGLTHKHKVRKWLTRKERRR